MTFGARSFAFLMILVVLAATPRARAALELTEVDIFSGMIEITNIGDVDFSGDTLEFCVPFIYGTLETSFTFSPGESRVYDMTAINPLLNLQASDDLWIYLDRIGGFANEQFVTSGVVWGSNQSGAGRVTAVVNDTGGAAWADATDFVDTSAVSGGQTLQLIPPGETPNSSSGWTIADSDFGNFGISCAFPDLDDDGNIAALEFDALVAQVVSGVYDVCFDLNSDGLLDLADMDQLRAIAGASQIPSGNPYLPGDANLDGFVDGVDFIEWNSNKFTATPAWTSGDFNLDGFVDGQDFIIWNSFKFQASDVAVPEPAAALLGWMGILLAARRRDACQRLNTTNRTHARCG